MMYVCDVGEGEDIPAGSSHERMLNEPRNCAMPSLWRRR